jgi:CPA1 family monovalent cation:H+ antiporter
MELFEVLLGLLAACVALAVVLVVGGMALALIPGPPTVELDPQLALVLFLPPLLQASAYRTDWPAF